MASDGKKSLQRPLRSDMLIAVGKAFAFSCGFSRPAWTLVEVLAKQVEESGLSAFFSSGWSEDDPGQLSSLLAAGAQSLGLVLIHGCPWFCVVTVEALALLQPPSVP